MLKFNGFVYPKHISEQAVHLISNLCAKSQSARYRPANALQHPWITRRFGSELPMTDQEKRDLSVANQPIEDKLRKAMRVLFVCAISRPRSSGQ